MRCNFVDIAMHFDFALPNILTTFAALSVRKHLTSKPIINPSINVRVCRLSNPLRLGLSPFDKTQTKTKDNAACSL